MSKDSNLVVEFRKIPSLKFLYEVSEDGRIVRNVKSKHQLAMDKDRGGYFRVSSVLNGKQIHRFVHILVAECWLGSKPDGMECDHIDHNKHNNHYTNLRYVTKEGTCISHPMTIYKNNEEYAFESKSKCAHFISEQTGAKYNTVCQYIRQKRKRIHGYDISYK